MASKSRLKTGPDKGRRIWPIVAILVFLAGIGTSVVYKKELTNLVDILQETFPSESDTITRDRGTIYDRNFKELAQTQERVSLYVRPREVKDIKETARLLSDSLGLSVTELLVNMEKDSHLVWLSRDIGQGDEEVVTGLGIPGIYLHREVARSYPQQEYASHLIGYSENDLGLAGVEHYYNRLLNQDRVHQEDIPAINLKGLTQTSTKGHDLVLTLDMKIQAILEKYVKTFGEKMGNGSVTSLLLNTENGKIVAGASYPSFNPNTVWQHKKEILEPLFLTPMVIPMEIRKFVHEASLLQGGWEKSTQVYPWSLIAGQADLGSQLRLIDRLQLTTDVHVDFSGGKKQQSSLPQFMETGPSFYLGAVPKTATPLKILLGMSHLLNDGKKIQPHMLDRIIERPDAREYFYDIFHGEVTGRNVFPSLVSRELRNLLMKQEKKGVLGSRTLSGETVSLVMNDLGGSYVRDRMGFVMIPAERPEMILLLVARDEELRVPEKDSIDFKTFCDEVESILPSMVALQQIHQNIEDIVEVVDGEEQNFKADSVNDTGGITNALTMQEKQTLNMPDLTGFSLRRSLRLLQSAEVDVSVKGTGRVVSQSPKAGVELKKGNKCLLTLA
ncbi:MAG: PASTA domain-containing protein, partial [Desulfocapsa sp.]|nr:PASTA domain-containing protein [Desulfocapsa sp.]